MGLLYPLTSPAPTPPLLQCQHTNCYQTQVQLLAARKLILKRQVLVGREMLLYSGGQHLGRWWTPVQKLTPNILLDRESF